MKNDVKQFAFMWHAIFFSIWLVGLAVGFFMDTPASVFDLTKAMIIVYLGATFIGLPLIALIAWLAVILFPDKD